MSKVKQAAMRASVRNAKPHKQKRQAASTSTAGARYQVKALDPLQKCGAGTSVQLLFKVTELEEGRSEVHLVFFDRHGWYCEHGRGCPAVATARKLGARH